MLRLYNTALLPLRLGVELWAAMRARGADGRLEWAERLARRLPDVPAGGAWIHGASVGEVRIVRGLAARLREERVRLPLAVSAYTASGRAQLPAPPDVDASFFVPLDFPGPTWRVLDALRPAVLVLIETELWPNLLHAAGAGGVAVAIVNGRLSEERMLRYRRLARLYRPLLGRVAVVGAQSEADAARFGELGVPPRAISVTGNVKYDLPVPPLDPATLRDRLGLAARRPVFVAGSTAPGEEALVLDAFAIARRAAPELLLVLAPRHVARAAEVAAVVAARGLELVRYASPGTVGPRTAVLLIDTLGDLPALYGLAALAFVGGSLTPVGGHNVLEPAVCGVPVLFGPHVDHFREPAEALLRSGGGRCLPEAAALGHEVTRLLADSAARHEMGRRAREVVEANRGALERSVALLLALLDARSPRPRPAAV